MCIRDSSLDASLDASLAAPNNQASYNPGFASLSTHCDGLVLLPGWAKNVTDGDVGTFRLDFLITGISTPDIFTTFPFVSQESARQKSA